MKGRAIVMHNVVRKSKIEEYVIERKPRRNVETVRAVIVCAGLGIILDYFVYFVYEYMYIIFVSICL